MSPPADTGNPCPQDQTDWPAILAGLSEIGVELTINDRGRLYICQRPDPATLQAIRAHRPQLLLAVAERDIEKHLAQAWAKDCTEHETQNHLAMVDWLCGIRERLALALEGGANEQAAMDLAAFEGKPTWQACTNATDAGRCK